MIASKSESRQYPDFAILKDEVKILQPDVLVFLIGHDYNAQMEEYIKDAELQIHHKYQTPTKAPEGGHFKLHKNKHFLTSKPLHLKK